MERCKKYLKYQLIELEKLHIFVYNNINYIYAVKDGKIMTRKRAREEAFILIFEKAFNDNSTEEILELAREVRDLEPDDYIEKIFFGVFQNISEIDALISQKAVGWKIQRISKTALSILRLAIYEIKFFDEIPNSVSINEAVELAKKYATKEDASFINGILSTIVKEL